MITVSQSPPFGLRKLSATLARTLGLDGATCPSTWAATPGSLLDAFAIASALAADGPPALVVATDHLVSYEDRVCDTLSAGAAAAFVVGASGGFARLGAQARAGREVYDVWRLGTEPEARYRLEVLFDAYGATTKEALAGLERETERGTADYAAVCASQPHPQTLRGPGQGGRRRRAAGGHVVRGGDRQPRRRLRRRRPRDGPRRAPRPATTCWRSATAAGRRSPRTSRSPARPAARAPPASWRARRSTCSTYYRWTRGRQAEPH